ncbi:class I SAM-dependent methyltransferase [Streptomyces sp. NPDC048361]|uniref:class I SAM-dependent methyltransferase n=1 Tax=Streptomyces sp. NPDC048361 TaxID=3154720 RepID=UPI0034206AAD
MNEFHSATGPTSHNRAMGSGGAMADLLELDAEVLAPYLAELTGWLAELSDAAPARILDLGSGPGTGSLVLAHRFPRAVVTAADISPQMLHRLQAQAALRGVTDRVRTLQANLDETWPQRDGEGPYDLMWAAAFLHHAAVPHRILTQAFERLRTGGLVAVTEMDFFPRFLPEDVGIGRSGLEARLHAATDTRPPSEWTDELIDAGFAVEARRPFEIALDRTQAGPALNRYAHVCLAKLRSHAATVLDTNDLATLDTLLDETQPHSIARRDDLCVRTVRTTWIGRRP